MIQYPKNRLIIFLTLLVPALASAEPIWNRLEGLSLSIADKIGQAYILFSSGFSLLFFLLLLLSMIPSLFKRNPGRIFYWLSLLCYLLYLSYPTFTDLLSESLGGPVWLEIPRQLFLWGCLIFFYGFYAKNFTRGWAPAIGIPFIVISLGLFLWIITPQLYEMLLFVFLRRIRDLTDMPLYNLLIGLFYLALLARLMTALVREEAFRLWALIILGAGLAVSLIQVIGQGIWDSSLEEIFMRDSMALMMILAMSRMLMPSTAVAKSDREPENERLYRELADSRNSLEKLQKDLTDEDQMIGKVLKKSKKLRETLLPPVIYPDKNWEASVYYYPGNPDQPDYYDFFYGPGRRLKGGVFFDIQNGMNGSFTGSWLKGTLSGEFVDKGSLSTLYRRLYKGTEEFREGSELLCQMIRLNVNELEYIGWKNAPMLYRSADKEKAASMIQDPISHWENIKSYRIQVLPGDAVLMTTEGFYSLPHNVTGEAYGVQRALESFSRQEGKATDMLRGLMQDRMKYYGDSRVNRDLFMLLFRRKV